MTLSRVKEQTAQKIFNIETCPKSIIRISKQHGGIASISKLLHLNKPVCEQLICAMYIELVQSQQQSTSIKNENRQVLPTKTMERRQDDALVTRFTLSSSAPFFHSKQINAGKCWYCVKGHRYTQSWKRRNYSIPQGM